MQSEPKKTTKVLVHKTADATHIRALTGVLERVLKGLSRDILFEVSDNGFITFRNYGLLRVIPGASLILNEAGAIGAAKLWMKQFNEWRMGQREGFAGYPANAAANFPDFFHKRLEYRNAVPVYKEEGSHKILHYWKVNYGLSTAEGAAIADHTVTLHVRHSGGGLLVGLDYHALPLLGETEETESALPLTDEQLKKNLIYRHDSSLQMYLPHLITETGVVPLTRLGVGVVRENGGGYLPFEDYFLSIDIEKKEMSFYLILYYNALDTRISNKISELKNLWTSKRVPYNEDVNGKIVYWTLNFNLQWKTVEKEVSDVNDFGQFEGLDIIHKEYPHAMFLSVRKGNDDINKDKDGLTEKFLMTMGRGAWTKEETVFSHELGHAFFNDLAVEDYNIINDIDLLPIEFDKQFIELKLIGHQGLQSQGTAKKANILNNGIVEANHYINMKHFLGPQKYILKIESKGEYENTVKPVLFRPNFSDNSQYWPEDISPNGNSILPKDYGYNGPPLLSYVKDEEMSKNRCIWFYEYRELIRANLLYLEKYLKVVYNTDFQKQGIKKYYMKRCSRIFFW